MKIKPNFPVDLKAPQIHKVPFLQENRKIIIQFILTALFIGLGIWFIRHQHAELVEVRNTLTSARKFWIILGLAVTVLFVALQGLMYFAAFSSLGQKINLFEAVILYLKRNFISIFLPAGGISSLAFFTSDLENKGIPKSQIHFASFIYGFLSIFSVILVSIPAFLYALHEGTIGKADWLGLVALIGLLSGFFYIYRSVVGRGFMYRWLLKAFPSLELLIEDLQLRKIKIGAFLLTLFFSILVEVVGIAHIYISILALGLEPTLLASVMAYLVAVIFLLVSPFLRGLGAIEVSTAFLLTRFGFNEIQSISITFLFRFFEFWIPMLLGIVSFLYKMNHIMMRILPALLLFSLGAVNIISVISPPMSQRVENLEVILKFDLVNASNYLVLIAGMFLFVVSAFLLKGLRTAWWFAFVLTALSVLGHLVKAIDYTEALIALAIFLVLFVTRKEYTIRHNWNVRSMGLQTAIFSIAAVMLYGILGFYFLDEKHFNMNFKWYDTIHYTFLNFILIGSSDLVPSDMFAKHFLYSINISSCFSVGLFLFVIIRPWIVKSERSDNSLSEASDIVFQYGTSSLDYFKSYPDKLIFFSPDKLGFIAYRISGNYAIVLEGPVAANANTFNKCIDSFSRYCDDNGLSSLYVGVSDLSLPYFMQAGKKNMLIGQEAIISLNDQSISDYNFMQAATEKLRNEGYKITFHNPPHNQNLMKELKSVSAEWLDSGSKIDTVFSQGMFLTNELRKYPLFIAENPKGKSIAFLNIIPNYIKGEASYDLFRVTPDAPNELIFYMLAELVFYLKSENYSSLNLGLVPLSKNLDENSTRYLSGKIKSVIRYTADREIVQMLNPEWRNRYLIYEDEYELLQIPSVISKVYLP